MSSPSRKERANAIRFLSADAIEKSQSGHPGAPLGMADIAEVLWNDFLVHNPENPNWFNRDRFILSNGHGSMLLYSVLHLSGYDLSINDIKAFRQLDSKTPGHPEYGYTPGVDTTTGPLGQGLANGVGMAIAEKTLGVEFNTQDHSIVDHYTYVFVGDGCMMEGISHEACSLAGTLGLGKLIVIWDDNGISIDGDVDGWFTDDTPARFRAYGWHVIENVDGHDSEPIVVAINAAREQYAKPTLICCRTIIGNGAPTKAATEACHGAPLGREEVLGMRKELEWESPPFDIPASISDFWNAREKGVIAEAEWLSVFRGYASVYPEKAKEFQRRISGELPIDWPVLRDAIVSKSVADGENSSTRQASLNLLNQLGPLLPELIGGSADLASSNFTIWDQSISINSREGGGNYIHFGVREFAMSAISNGIALHGGFKVYCGTFLVFSDYMRNSMRMSALMKLPVIYVLTHDSIGLGEDGPTHQPVEHTASLRLIPNMQVWRPCDSVESGVAWTHACEVKDAPSSLIFSRQALPHQQRTVSVQENIVRGGYILQDCAGLPEVIIIATGSEVQLAIAAQAQLSEMKVNARVVSMPCAEIFDLQSPSYRELVLQRDCKKRVAIEAGIADYWFKYVGFEGLVIGMKSFGESAPASTLFGHFGFSKENVFQKIEQYLRK